MGQLNVNSAVTTDFKNNLPDYSVPSKQTDAAQNQDETEYQNPNAGKYLGYYKTIPELKKAIDALATWTLGQGYTADAETTVILDHITGWGEDTFNSVLWNLLVQKKVYGDAFAEIMRDEKTGIIINIKPLDPGTIKVIVNRQGKIKRYEQWNKVGKENKLFEKFRPEEILHLVNDRIADEIHGVSVIEACEQTILARNEALSDWKTILHRNVVPLKIIYADTDDNGKLTELRDKLNTIVKDKEWIVVPEGSMKVEIPTVPLQDPIQWIKYLEDFFPQAVGVPKVILGGSSEFTEASSKTAYLTFEQVYVREQTELAADLWNQIQLRVKFNKPVSLKNELLTSEAKNTGQTSFQPNEVGIGQGAIE
jgi:hypothetical protein